jgi:hypothetical protein
MTAGDINILVFEFYPEYKALRNLEGHKEVAYWSGFCP